MSRGEICGDEDELGVGCRITGGELRNRGCFDFLLYFMETKLLPPPPLPGNTKEHSLLVARLLGPALRVMDGDEGEEEEALLWALQQQMASAIKTEWAVVYHSGFSACFITSSDSGIFFIALERGYDHFLPLEMKLILQQRREGDVMCRFLYCLHHISAVQPGYGC